MIPPTTTQQEHKAAINKKTGRVVFYDPPELAAARAKLTDYVGRFAPEHPILGPVRLITKWIWPLDMPALEKIDPDYFVWKETKPDTDNLIKLLKDCMTRTGFWKDDAQVVSEITEKFLAFRPGIYIQIVTL